MAEALLSFLPAARTSHPAIESDAGFALGWDHARYGLVPPPEHMVAGNPLRQGWEAGRAAFGRRTRESNPNARRWLQLRLTAWLQGRHFEALTVTPNFLGQIDSILCPVTREALDGPQAGVVARVCEDAGYAAGNLAVLGQRAAAAKAGLDFEEAVRLAEQAHRGEPSAATRAAVQPELTAPQWARLAVLLSFVTPLPHARAASLPLLVLPPNRLRVLNPIQGLQTLVTLLLAKSGWSQRLPKLEALLPSAAARRELRAFFMVYMPRVIAGGRPDDAAAWRRALEDAWRHPLVQSHWKRFALQLDAQSSQAVLEQAIEAGLMTQRVQLHTEEQATEGWSLETRGYTEKRATPRRRLAARPTVAPPQLPAACAPQQLAMEF
jgi:hypothetical protein